MGVGHEIFFMSKLELTLLRRQNSVTVLVGSEEVPFEIHASKLEEQSPGILALISHIEGRSEAAIPLPDVDEQTMDIVVNWLYTERLCKIEASAEAIEKWVHKDETNDEAREGEEVKITVSLDADANSLRESSESPTIADATTPAPSSSRSTSTTPHRSSASLAHTQSTDAFVVKPDIEGTDHAKTTSNLEYADIFSVYKFATQYGFPTLKLEALKCWQRRSSMPHPQPEPVLISRIFNLPADDIALKRQVARQYAIEFCNGAMPETIEKTQEKMMGLHPNFFPLMMYFQGCIFQHRLCERKYKALWCDFHYHNTSEEGKACMAARQAELQDMSMRKGKKSWQEADRLLKKIQYQRKVLCEPGNMSKKVSSLIVDGDGIVAGMKGGKE
jgi:hypothetical protein